MLHTLFDTADADVGEGHREAADMPEDMEKLLPCRRRVPAQQSLAAAGRVGDDPPPGLFRLQAGEVKVGLRLKLGRLLEKEERLGMQACDCGRRLRPQGDGAKALAGQNARDAPGVGVAERWGVVPLLYLPSIYRSRGFVECVCVSSKGFVCVTLAGKWKIKILFAAFGRHLHGCPKLNGPLNGR